MQHELCDGHISFELQQSDQEALNTILESNEFDKYDEAIAELNAALEDPQITKEQQKDIELQRTVPMQALVNVCKAKADELKESLKKSLLLAFIDQMHADPGTGRARLDSLILRNLPETRLHRVLGLIISSLVGRVTKYPNEGDYIVEIKEQRRTPGTIERPSFRNNRIFQLHTDLSYEENPPPFFVLQSVSNPPREGGVSVFCDLDDSLKRLSSSELKQLQEPQFIFQAPAHYTGKSEIVQPIIRRSKSAWHVRFRRDYLRSLTRPGIEAVIALLNAFDDTAYDTKLEANSLVIINNLRVPHGRTAFSANEYSAQPRHLNRIYIDGV